MNPKKIIIEGFIISTTSENRFPLAILIYSSVKIIISIDS